jgi:hypothetical protein
MQMPTLSDSALDCVHLWDPSCEPHTLDQLQLRYSKLDQFCSLHGEFKTA